jgi:hypothetical protein
MNDLNPYSTFYLIPKEDMDELIQAVRDLRAMREEMGSGSNSEALGDYVAEEKAMELLCRGKTWFWSKRKSGELIGRKAAGRWYYQLNNLKKFIENGKSNF